jgi:hypothetical protein
VLHVNWERIHVLFWKGNPSAAQAFTCCLAVGRAALRMDCMSLVLERLSFCEFATPLENRACTGLVLLVVALHVSLSAALLSMCLVWVMFGCSKIFRIHPEILLMDGILVIKFRKFCYCVALPVWYLQEQKI